MTVYMPPIARKKKVDERYNPDSFRLFGQEAEETHPRYPASSYRASFEPPTPEERLFPDISCGRTRVLPKPTPDFRVNNPHPKSCSFIRTDVRLLNDPICTVHTKETHPEQNRWWPARANKGTLEKGDHTLDTIYRNDFLYTRDIAPQASYRHSANPNTTAARGIAPVNFMKEKGGQQGFYQESVSFEHQYDSRSDPNYPIRGKRHGAFVYSKMSPEAKQKFIEQQTQPNQESQAACPPKQEKPGCDAQVPLIYPEQVSRADAKVPSPEMLQTSSSPMEWYNPETDTLKPKASAPNQKRHGAFVYSKMSPEAKLKFIEQQTQLNQESQAACPPQQEKPGCNAQAPLSSPKQVSRADAKVPSPEMLQTSSSPMEWYNPETDTLKPKASAPNPKAG